eukprot:m.182877 g.182877  ORF g.182877 m.182877 type:complete len:67 (-) comp32136_c4_seq1:1146-1346(-)
MKPHTNTKSTLLWHVSRQLQNNSANFKRVNFRTSSLAFEQMLTQFKTSTSTQAYRQPNTASINQNV